MTGCEYEKKCAKDKGFTNVRGTPGGRDPDIDFAHGIEKDVEYEITIGLGEVDAWTSNGYGLTINGKKVTPISEIKSNDNL